MATIKLTQVKNYSSLWEKIKGVIGETEPKGYGEGIALPDVNSIHTFFVGFNLDLVFLNKDNLVIKLVEDLKPWHFSPVVLKAKTTLELKRGSIKNLGVKLGDRVDY